MKYDYVKQGDCLELMKEIPDVSVDLVCTDIPYGVCNREDNGLRNLDKGNAGVVSFDLPTFLQEVSRITSGSVYIFCASEQLSEIRKSLIDNKFTTRVCVGENEPKSHEWATHLVIWRGAVCIREEKGASFNEHCKNTVSRYPCGRNKLPPTQKPIELMEQFITASTNDGDIVLDPCMGSGSTCVAAINTGRHYIGFEKDPQYFEIAKRRIKEVSE